MSARGASRGDAHRRSEARSGTARTRELFETALQRHRAGDLASAEAGYRQVLVADPRHAFALHYLGVLAHQTGHHAEAVELIETAIRITPEDAEFHSNLGEALRALGRLDDAERCYREAIDRDPNLVEAWNNLGVVLRERGNAVEALTVLDAARAQAPGSFELAMNRGITLRDLGRSHEAARAFLRAIEMAPATASAPLSGGAAMLAAGEAQRAIEILEAGARRWPGEPRIGVALAFACNAARQFAVAETRAREAVEAMADGADARIALAVSLAGQERMSAAEEVLGDLDPRVLHEVAAACIEAGLLGDAEMLLRELVPVHGRDGRPSEGSA